MEYWLEHAEIAMDEAKLDATPEQLDTIAGVIESAHEFYSQSMGHDVATANWQGARGREIEDLKKAVQRERDKVTCSECTNGRIITYYLNRRSDSQCWKCNGDGRVDP